MKFGFCRKKIEKILTFEMSKIKKRCTYNSDILDLKGSISYSSANGFIHGRITIKFITIKFIFGTVDYFIETDYNEG